MNTLFDWIWPARSGAHERDIRRRLTAAEASLLEAEHVRESAIAHETELTARVSRLRGHLSVMTYLAAQTAREKEQAK